MPPHPEAFGKMTPAVTVPPPGRRSLTLAAELRNHESRNVTFLGPDFPVFWEGARGSNVRDVDGNVYVDLTAAFAVASAGHAHPRIVAAVRAQAGRLLHGMGDVHPPEIKARLLRELARATPAGLTRGILANSGAEAVEAALKTAALATGKPRVIAFHGGYHGLTYGALPLSGREEFRAPFRAQLRENALFAPYPSARRNDSGDALREVERLLDAPGGENVGAVLVEPVLGRGGTVVPPPDFLPALRSLCDRRGLLLVLDEIYTGFGRTGRWFACEHTGVVPDLLVVGKALAGGLPFAACLGTDPVMEAWPPSPGEALHTSTFLGHPLACAAALASMETLRDEGLVERAASVGSSLIERLRTMTRGHPRVAEVRGVGMMIGVEMVRDLETAAPAPQLAREVMIRALRRGVLVLGGGVHGNVISLSPPFVITERQVDAALGVLDEALQSVK